MRESRKRARLKPEIGRGKMSAITLDSNAYSAFMRGDDRVLDEIARVEKVYLPLFVVGELHYGFRGGSRLRENLRQLEQFLDKPSVKMWLPTAETAEIYGELKDFLKRKGSPIPINDVWIASAAIETGSKLVTFDQHFNVIPSLRVWDR
jgi:tRNA(fMet)-specific endonuclease VapC